MLHTDWQTYLDDHPTDSGSGAGPFLAWLPELALVRFSGNDAAGFLQGYLTCDTATLTPDRATPAALCNLKGRVVTNGWCALAPDGDPRSVLFILHASLRERLAAFLKAYMAFSRTHLEDLDDQLVVLVGLDLDEAPPPADVQVLEMDPRRRLYLCHGLAAARACWEAHPQRGAEAWRAALIEDGVPLLAAEVSETFLPQMLNLDRLGAVDFQKGCYLGQEVVARAQHRGQVKRRLQRLHWRGRQPQPGSEISDGAGRPQGTVVQSAATSNDAGEALAVLRESAAQVQPDDSAEGGLRQDDTVLIPAG